MAVIAMLPVPHDVDTTAFEARSKCLRARSIVAATLRLAWSSRIRAIRARDPTVSPSLFLKRSGSNPSGRGFDATACSVNPNRRCLNVDDRYP